MAECPKCGIALNRMDYDGIRTFQCRDCGGQLVTLRGLESRK